MVRPRQTEIHSIEGNIMNARNALLRGVGAAFDNGEAIETLADDINLMLDVLIPNPEDRVRAVTRLQRIEALAGHGRATGEARKVASLIAVRTLRSPAVQQRERSGRRRSSGRLGLHLRPVDDGRRGGPSLGLSGTARVLTGLFAPHTSSA